MGNEVGKFITYDYSNEFEKEEDWKKKIKQIISSGLHDAEILSSTIFSLPLQGLGCCCFHKCGDIRGVKHVLVIFECMKDNRQKFYLSIEKDTEGITVQYSEEENTIKKKKRGKKRKGTKKLDKAKKGDYSFTKPINELIGLKCPKVMTVLNRWKTVPDYNVITGNCQDLVDDILEIFREISNENDVKLKFPASDKMVQLSVGNKTDIIDLYERFSEGYKVNPRNVLPNDYPHQVYFEEDRLRLQKNEVKEKLDVLITKCFGDKDIYFNHLHRNKMEMTLKDVTKAGENLTNAKINEIATFWNTEIDGVIISENYGVIIIVIADDDDNDEKVKQRRDGAERLIKKLINIVSEKEEDIAGKKNITIQIDNKEPNSPCRIVENRIQIGKSRVSEDISEEFQKLLKKVLKKKTTFSFTNEPQRKFLAALLLIFQNMENFDAMLFKCITNQNWDTGSNHIVWTREQKEIINVIDLAFEKDPRKKSKDTRKPLSELIVGCPGSGKTLILLYACRKYCNKFKDAKVLFIVQNQYTALRQHIKTCLEDLILMDRVIIKDELRSDGLMEEDIGLIVCDEFYKDMIDDDNTKADFENASNDGVHVLIASMDCDIAIHFENMACAHMLGGANYRSTKAILQLVCKVQRNLNCEVETVFVDDSTFMEIPTGCPRFNDPVHFKYMDGHLRNLKRGEISIENLIRGEISIKGDTSFERTGFINECVDYIINQIKNKSFLTKGKVLIYNICHFNILLRIKEEIKNKIENGDITEKEYNNLVFLDSRASQGAQYASSIGIFDHASLPYYPQNTMITALTRTILSAHLLINIAKHPPYHLSLQSQHKTQCIKHKCIEFDNIYGTSQLGKILETIRDGRKKITVLFSTEDTSIAIDQIDDEAYEKKDLDSDYCGDVDVIIGNFLVLNSVFARGCSSIHSQDLTFVVTYDDYERGEARDYEEKNEIIRELLIIISNQNDLFVPEI